MHCQTDSIVIQKELDMSVKLKKACMKTYLCCLCQLCWINNRSAALGLLRWGCHTPASPDPLTTPSRQGMWSAQGHSGIHVKLYGLSLNYMDFPSFCRYTYVKGSLTDLFKSHLFKSHVFFKTQFQIHFMSPIPTFCFPTADSPSPLYHREGETDFIKNYVFWVLRCK